MTKREIMKKMQELENTDQTEENFYRYGELEDKLIKLYNEEKGILKMDNIIGYINQGYEIIEQGKEYCMGYSKTKDEFVSWGYSYNEDTGKPFFFWGRYGGLEFVAEQYADRENRI